MPVSEANVRTCNILEIRHEMFHEDFSVIYSGTIVQADLLKCLLEAAGVQAGE